jgi:hypothetical protein
VRVENVAEVIGILCGCKVEKKNFNDRPVGGREFDYVRVPEARVRPTEMPAMVSIQLPKKYVFYHFEADSDKPFGGPQAGYRYISIASCAFNIALARKLVETFGGRVVYQDVADRTFSRPNYQRPEFRYNGANDGTAYEKLQRRIASVKPLTQEDVEKCVKWAGYDYYPSDWRNEN